MMVGRTKRNVSINVPQPTPASDQVRWSLYWPLTLHYIATFVDEPEANMTKMWISYACDRARWRMESTGWENKLRFGESIPCSALINALLRWTEALFMKPKSSKHQKVWRQLGRSRYNLMEELWEIHHDQRMKHNFADIYSPLHELSDRLALLVDELNSVAISEHESLPGKVHGVKKHLDKRVVTTYIRAPHAVDIRVSLPYVSLRIKERTSLYAENLRWTPWELACNNHLIKMQCFCELRRSRPHYEIVGLVSEIFDLDCGKFLQSSLSIVPSWDHTFENTVANWWNLEPAVLLASCLVDALMATLPAAVDVEPSLEDTAEGKLFFTLRCWLC